MSLAFLLPTNRAVSHPNVLREALESINRFHNGHTIYVMSEHQIIGPNIVWVPEDCDGPITAFNKLANFAYYRGAEWFVCSVDDHRFLGSIKSTINDVGLLMGKFKIGGLVPEDKYGISCPCFIPKKGDKMGDYTITEDWPAVPTIRFPVFHRSVFESLGKTILHNSLKYHAGDIWLSYWLSRNRYFSIESGTRINQIEKLKDSTQEVEDCNTVYKLVQSYYPGKPYSE